MHHRFEYCLSRDEYVAGLATLMNELRKHDPWRSRVLWEQGLAIVALMLLVSLLFPKGVFAVLIVAFLVSIFEFVMRPRWSRGMTGVSYDPTIGEETVEITSEGIAQRSSARLRSWPWASVRQVHDVDSGVVFETAGWDMVMLPARLWESAQARHDFVAQLPCAAAAPDPGQPRKAPAPTFAAMLPIASLAAAVELIGLALGLWPRVAAPIVPVGTAKFFLALALALLLCLGMGYAVFRVVRMTLVRLHDWSPRAADVAVQAVLWAIPVYFIAAYFGWI